MKFKLSFTPRADRGNLRSSEQKTKGSRRRQPKEERDIVLRDYYNEDFQARLPRDSVGYRRASLHNTHCEYPFDPSARYFMQEQSRPTEPSVDRYERDTAGQSKQNRAGRPGNPRIRESIFLCTKPDDVCTFRKARGTLRLES